MDVNEVSYVKHVCPSSLASTYKVSITVNVTSLRFNSQGSDKWYDLTLSNIQCNMFY